MVQLQVEGYDLQGFFVIKQLRHLIPFVHVFLTLLANSYSSPSALLLNSHESF